VLPTDVQSVAKDVMAHRVVLGFDAVADNIAPAQVIERIVAMVPPPTPVWNQQSGTNHQNQPGRTVPSANTYSPPSTPYQQPVPNMPNQPDFS
jgi:MoxR-like ATPase